MKILLVEDDRFTSEALLTTLANHKYIVEAVEDGLVALKMATQCHFDLVLLDVVLPTLDGIEVCQKLRSQGCQIPILMLTARDSNEDVIAGLNSGADDYVPKSCPRSQLLARIQTLLRRTESTSSRPMLKWGSLCLDCAAKQVTYHQQTILLRPKELVLLELFLHHPKRLFSRGDIIDYIWTIDDTPVEGSVTNLIKDLRQRLKMAGMEVDPIETVHGFGYRLKPQEEIEKRVISGNEESTSSSEALPSQIEKQFKSLLVNKVVELNKGETASEVVFSEKEDVSEREVAKRQVRERFKSSLGDRIALLEKAEWALQTGGLNAEQLKLAKQEIHRLAGGLGTFGYQNGSELARKIENLLLLYSASQTVIATQFKELLEELKQELKQWHWFRRMG